jgi:Xaa-Pro aminopeptidase
MFEAHFQSFEERGNRAAGPARLAALRGELKSRGLGGFVVPRADRFQNEYVPPSDERLAWLTGFTGSAGLALALIERAVIFVDGRYQVQVREEVDDSAFEIAHLTEEPPPAWIEANLAKGVKLGYSPWLHTLDGAERLARACAAAGAELIPVDDNPLDAVWTDHPAPPTGAVTEHPLRHAGEKAASKIARVQAELARRSADILAVTDPHAVSWLFNIRGADVPHTPVALAFALVPQEGTPALYIDPRKLDSGVRAYLEALAEIRTEADFAGDLARRGAAHDTIRLDASISPEAVARIVSGRGGHISRGSDPIAPMKAVKNAAEIEGARAAHVRDGAAVTRFLAWLDREAVHGELTEIDAVKALESFRRDTGCLKDVSFPTIAGAGPNGAIVHYRVTARSNRRIAPGEVFLIDSGAQYEDGTTDITRTVSIGPPRLDIAAELRDNFTRVLKGHIAIATAVFPDGTSGAQLDPFARQFLWRAGRDFDHGTGHGVGSYLSVHEGPARISKLGSAPLNRGMILSNEPGYYRAGEYGIRIENLVLVTAADIAGADKKVSAFETLTLAPIDRRLIAPHLLTADECAWLDAYHARVREQLAPELDARARDWLIAGTRPLAR